MGNASLLMEPIPSIDRPGYIVGWDKAVGGLIVSKNGSTQVVTPVGNKGTGIGRSIVVSAI